MRNRLLIIVVTTLLALFPIALPILAEDSSESTPSAGSTSSPKPLETPKFGLFRQNENESPKPSGTPRIKGFDKLNDIRLKVCRVHEDEIGNRLFHLGELVTSMLGKFDAIAMRVGEFYTTKAAPSGHTISNYGDLVAEIASKKAAVQTALTNAQSDVAGFNCTGDNPKGQIRQYRLDMQAVKKALQDYRTAIKNLIVAVRTAVGGNESPKSSETPETTATPIATATPTATP